VRTIIEPFRIRAVEPIRMTTRAERDAALARADWNLFQLPARDVMIDLLTDSGTCAMSTRQWAAVMAADESYAGSESFFELQSVVRDLTGFRHVFPVHQGRAAERILFALLGGPGKAIPNNTHFDTTRANVLYTKSTAVDLPVASALDPQDPDPFKGNVDLDGLQRFLDDAPRGSVPLGLVTVTNNTVGGHPVAMANLRAAGELYRAHRVPFFLDAARFAENAYLIQQSEPGYRDVPMREIVREMFAQADGCMISAKKDGLVNIGGLLCLNDDRLADRVRELLILTEGFPTYGGLAGRDLAAMAVGLQEVLDPDYLAYRLASSRYLAAGLERLGVPVMRPSALHAVYVDARALLPRILPPALPGQAVACALYSIGGIRSVEIGTLMFGGKDPHSGEPHDAKLELVRLCLARRVYTQSHVDWVLEAFAELVQRKGELRGFEILWQPDYLRAFTARLRPLAG
jgi:tryptophanase